MNFNRDYKYLNFMITSSNQIPEFKFFPDYGPISERQRDRFTQGTAV